MLAAVRSATLLGVAGRPVTVEVHVGAGLPGFLIVGLPDEACRESRDRVRAALMSSGLRWPDRKITVNLAPVTLNRAKVESEHGNSSRLRTFVQVNPYRR